MRCPRPSNAAMTEALLHHEGAPDTAATRAVSWVFAHEVPAGDACEIWGHGNITYFAGHNVFKFAPAIGKLLADAALRTPSGDDANTPKRWVVGSPIREAAPTLSAC
jgi:glycine/D-amino acid oxidase-like deaminating enzyme